MTQPSSVRFGDTTIEYQVRRSPRRKKTVQITVDGAGVQVAAPVTTLDDEIQAMVRKRAPWILQNAADAQLAAAPKRFVSGETLPYLGKNVRLVVEPADVRYPQVRFDHWRFRISVPRTMPDDQRWERIRHAMIAWYRQRAAVRMEASVARWWPRFGEGDQPRVLIRNQRQRWGSCAPDGTLRFNWRVVMLEPALAEFVVVHELAHLSVKNHSPEFWALVAAALPDAQHRRRRLRDAGRALPM